MLRVCLLDKQSSQILWVVNTHLKAKAGSANDVIREHQVGTNLCLLWFLPTAIMDSHISLLKGFPDS